MDDTIRGSCPLCGQVSYNVLAHSLRRSEGKVLKCLACDHGFLLQHERFDAKKFYSDEYRQEYSHLVEPTATNARELFDVYSAYQAERLNAMRLYLKSDTSLLEVGASAGQFLFHVKDVVGKVNAIELDRECSRFLTEELGIENDIEFLEESRFADETYDVVCAFQVIEHVDQPVEFLKTLRRATKEDGTIFVEAPNLSDPLLSVWDVPTYQNFFYHNAHLHYFTESSLNKVARDAGFSSDQIEVSYTQDYNILNHLHWIMNDGPQTSCHVGLSDIDLRGKEREISTWLNDEIRQLNQKYVSKLIDAKCTSNIMMKLRHG